MIKGVVNAKMATWQALWRFLLYSLHLFLYGVLRGLQAVYWRISGIQGHIDQCYIGENYDTSAQLLKIWSRCTDTELVIHQRHHFLSTHVAFVNPEFALQKHVSLITVTDKEAIFAVPSPHENVFNVKKWPFLYIGQFKTAKYLLVMPTSSLNRLADKLGNPKAKVIWVHNTGRCGSTALAQMFNTLPDAVVLSEPTCTFSLNRIFKMKYFGMWNYDWENSQDYLKLYQSTMRILLKPKPKEASIMVVKGMPMSMPNDMKIINMTFPEFSNIYLYREAREQVSSMFKAVAGCSVNAELTHFISRCYPLSSLLPKVRSLWLMYASCSNVDHLQWISRKSLTLKNFDFVLFTASWAESCFHFRKFNENQRKEKIIPALKYEHWLTNQDQYLKTLFNCLGLALTEERISFLREALKEDSQKDSHLSREMLKSRDMQITPSMINEANEFLNYYRLPKWGEPLTLPNTITRG